MPRAIDNIYSKGEERRSVSGEMEVLTPECATSQHLRATPESLAESNWHYVQTIASSFVSPLLSLPADPQHRQGERTQSVDNNERWSARADNERRAARAPPCRVVLDDSLPGPTKDPVGKAILSLNEEKQGVGIMACDGE